MKQKKRPLAQAIRKSLWLAMLSSPAALLQASTAQAFTDAHPGSGQTLDAGVVTSADRRIGTDVDDLLHVTGVNGSSVTASSIHRVRLKDGTRVSGTRRLTLAGNRTRTTTTSQVDVDGDYDFTASKPDKGKKVWLKLGGNPDYGDAPAPYPTLAADGGASHALDGPTLGALRDGELDGAPSANADGDDLAGIDDEDGVSFGPARVGATDNGVVVNVQGEPGKLDAWIDFNGDGSWNGADEHIFDSVDVAVGDNTLFFDVPGVARSIVTQSRFRISRNGALGVGGGVDNGEVEDHTLNLQPPNGSGGTFVDSGQVRGTNNGTQAVILADLDGDGDLDLFEGNYGGYTPGKRNRVYLNDGAGNLVDSGQLLDTDDTFGADAADYDGDGDIDIAAINLGQQMRLYKNDGSGVFSLDQSLSPGLATDGRFADVDGDGDPDLIVVVLGSPDRIFLNDGSGVFSDSGQRLGTDSRTLSVVVGDVDNDGDIDFIEGNDSRERNVVYLNDGSGTFSASSQLLTTNRTNGAALGDVDGDGDLDLIEGVSSGSVLRLNDGSGDFSGGSTTLTNSRIYQVALADVDGDGDLDLVEGNESSPNRILLNDGNGNFSDSGQALGNTYTTSVALGDLDGDGDLDIVEGNYRGPNKVWFNGAQEVSMSVSANAGSETSQTVITVTATTALPVSGDQTVDLLVDGSGITNADYSLSAAQIQILDGTSSGSVTFTILDDLEIEGDETATIRFSGYSSMLFAGATVTQDVLIADNDTVPVLTGLSIAPSVFSENAGSATITGTLSNAISTETCFDLSFGGTATFDVDYSSSDGDGGSAGIQLCVPAGTTEGTVVLSGIDDAVYEGDETISVSSGSVNAAATVSDDEAAPTITAMNIVPGAFSENGGSAVLTAMLTNASSTPACFDLSLAGTALVGTDFTISDDDAGTAGTQICFAAGTTTATADLAGIDDGVYEGDESIEVSSSGQLATATLTEDDSAPVLTGLSFAPTSFSENAGSSILTGTISITSTTDSCFDLSYSGTASLATDYTSSDDNAGYQRGQRRFQRGRHIE
jgi:hypothetical protein